MVSFELSAPERLGRTVVLGYCDIGAAGIRKCTKSTTGALGIHTMHFVCSKHQDETPHVRVACAHSSAKALTCAAACVAL